MFTNKPAMGYGDYPRFPRRLCQEVHVNKNSMAYIAILRQLITASKVLGQNRKEGNESNDKKEKQ